VQRPRRHPVLRTALVVLAVLLAGSTGAPAAHASSAEAFPVGGAEFQRAHAIAQAHWGAVPCQGAVRFEWVGLEPLTNARATWSNPTDAWGNAAANFDCHVAFNALTQYDFAMLCTVLTHELGHLLGRQHDPQAGQLMSAIYTAPIRECSSAAPSPGPVADSAATEGDGDPIAWSVSEPKARPKQPRAKQARTKASRRRCVVRFKAGKRTKRCVVLKKRSSRKARKASVARRYSAH
jgi:hypothetical protein